jgi:hypothetical protein
MALNKRERGILWLTIGVFCAFILWQWGIGPLYADYAETSELLETQRKTFEDNRKTLGRAKDTERQYKAIEAQFPKQEEGKRADHGFIEDVISQVEGVLGARPKDIQPVAREKMKDVPGYDFLTFSMRVTGELDKLSQLLKSFDQKGFLIQTLVLLHPDLDNPQITLDITLARIVKQEEEKKGTRRRPGSLSLGREREL